MTDAVPGVAIEPDWAADGVLAARTRPGSGIHQAVLRREHDVFCLSVVVEPDPADGLLWADLDAQWSAVMAPPTPGVLGVARLFLACLPEPGAPPSGVPADPSAPATWPDRGITVPQGFAVWEASAPDESRAQRRLVVLAGEEQDAELSSWAWIGAGLALPPLAKYLLHAAKLRYQVRVWQAAPDSRDLRAEADSTIRTLLAAVRPGRDPAHGELLDAARRLTSLQARELGLIDRSTRLREMGRTVDIATANLAAFAGDPHLGGLFEDDRGLAEWFAGQLDDDATYLEAALQRCAHVSALVDQILQRARQRRQESVNLALTGVVGAILMSLAAIQSLQYTVPLSAHAKPAVIAVLGSLALLASLVVLRVVVPDRRWSLVPVHLGCGVVAAMAAWIVFPEWTVLFSGAAFVAGTAVAAVLGRRAYRPK
ncbi:hypothetical protein LV75_001856 [Actinokineospora diospyrosa]|uniref:Uncharacterized protein n=2 Tax=Actinokineospora diospyrosa TaxID=103728 RepID=A0ABT1I9Q9_9PSEU|nr:hypothetical protein [Actinokineospora diospyrosa]